MTRLHLIFSQGLNTGALVNSHYRLHYIGNLVIVVESGGEGVPDGTHSKPLRSWEVNWEKKVGVFKSQVHSTRKAAETEGR